MPPEPDQATVLRVVVVDADDRVRESLSGLLCIGDHLEVVGTAGQTGPALELVASTRPDIVVLDPRLPGVDGGLSFISRLRALAPDVRILVVCGSDALEQGELGAAADGIIRKTFRPSDLQAAVLAAWKPEGPVTTA
jgi:DNA-binding NarL/FixJ family response regulator